MRNDDDGSPPPPPELDQTVTGSDASELIFGSALRDLIQGLGGADTVFAGDGDDVLEGGGDRDFLVAEGGADTGFGGDGDDVLFGGSGADSLLGEADVDFLFGEAGANTLDGGAGNDRIHIVRDDVIAAGGEGVFDVLVVLDAAGPLTIDLGNVANQNTTGSGPVVTGIEAVDASLSNQPVNVRGAALNGFGNVLFTSGLNDTVTGSSLADIILGGGGDDVIDGGDGDDTLIADQGSDTLTGGAGADDFFHPGAGSTMRVADFAHGSDHVVLLASSGLTAEQALAQTVQQGADAVLSLVGGGTIILAGVNIAALSAGDFAIVA
jgi:Ca2+-binding RTX toxin-like protein